LGNDDRKGDSNLRRSLPTYRRFIVFRILAVIFGIVIGLVAVEFGLRLVEKYRLGDRSGGETVSDPELGVP